MKNILLRIFAVAITSCVTNPYKASEKEYDNKLKTLRTLFQIKSLNLYLLFQKQ
jgi:hypothetical protein